MRKYPAIPELVEQFIQEEGADERGYRAGTPRTIQTDAVQGNTVSGFLRRLESGPCGKFPFIGASIIRKEGENPSDPKKCRYLLKLRITHILQRKHMKPVESMHGSLQRGPNHS